MQAMLRASCGNAFTDNFVDAYHVHETDITCEKDEKKIIGALNDIVLSWRNGGEKPFQKIPVSDVARIIHVIDTDGAFIPDSAVKQTDDAKAQYYDKSICFFDRNKIVGLHHRKIKVINKLLETKTIDNIPYSIYFSSCNMDHVLFNERNPIRSQKDRGSFEFAIKCKNRDYLNSSIFAPDVAASGTYSESWEMIQKDYNSLARHTNLNLLLDGVIIGK